MSMPITLRGAADALPGMPGFSFGLLTFALFLGFLPTWLGIPGPAEGWFLSLGAALSLALMVLVLISVAVMNRFTGDDESVATL